MPSHNIITVIGICLVALFNSSCSSELYKDNATHLSAGNKITLTKPFEIKKLFSHVIFQDGEIINETELTPYRVSCIFDAYNLGPKSVQPSQFNITKVTYNDEMYSDSGAVVRYFTEFYLESTKIETGQIETGQIENDKEKQSNKNILTCQILDDTLQYHPFSLTEIKQATGLYFDFSY